MASSPADYRKEAEDYVRQADTLQSGTRRLRLLDMAQSCIRLADQAEWLADDPLKKLNGKAPPPLYSGL
jgi:hypothetical protein